MSLPGGPLEILVWNIALKPMFGAHIYRYIADWVYGHATLYFFCAIVFVFAVPHVLSRIWRASKRENPLKSNKIWQRAVASSRFLGYRSFHLRGLNWYSPAAGVMLLGLAGVIYFFGNSQTMGVVKSRLTMRSALTLGPKPYYWPNTAKFSFGGSPPIATRSGWMSLAMLPFVMYAHFILVICTSADRVTGWLPRKSTG